MYVGVFYLIFMPFCGSLPQDARALTIIEIESISHVALRIRYKFNVNALCHVTKTITQPGASLKRYQ